MNAPTRISTEVDDATLAKIEAAAAFRGLSLDAFVQEALQHAADQAVDVDGHDAAWRTFVQTGLDSAERGEFVSQDAMEAWFEERVVARRTR